MNVDHEDELRIQAPPGAASASESRLQLDGTGLMPEAQERKQRATAHTNSFRENLKENISLPETARPKAVEGERVLMRECVRVRVCGEP